MTWCCRPRDGRHQNHARGLCSRVKSSGGQARGSGCNEQGSANAQLSSQHPEPVPPCSRSFVHYLTGGRSGHGDYFCARRSILAARLQTQLEAAAPAYYEDFTKIDGGIDPAHLAELLLGDLELGVEGLGRWYTRAAERL